MEQGHFMFILSEDEESAGTLIKAMENVEIVVVILILEKIFNGVVVMSASSMDDDAGRFADNQKIVGIVDYFDR
jgi:hypothetical protein